jgi:hypothetical protein
MKRMSGGAKRQCDRALRPQLPAGTPSAAPGCTARSSFRSSIGHHLGVDVRVILTRPLYIFYGEPLMKINIQGGVGMTLTSRASHTAA